MRLREIFLPLYPCKKVMIAKLFGCGLLFVASLSASVLKLRKEKRRLALIEGWINFLSFAKSEIEYAATPLSRLLEKTDPAFLELLGAEEKSLDGYLAASEKDLDRESVECLSSLVLSFGLSYREDLLTACKRTLSILSQKKQRLASELPKEKRQTLSISLLAAALAILLLW